MQEEKKGLVIKEKLRTAVGEVQCLFNIPNTEFLGIAAESEGKHHVSIFDLRRNCITKTLKEAHSNHINFLATSSGMLYSGSADHTMHCWSIVGDFALLEKTKFDSGVNAVLFTRRQDLLLVGTGNAIRVLNTRE